MKPGAKRPKSVAGAIGVVLAILVGNLNAQQVPIPQTAAEVPGPALGPMSKAYVQMVGRMAYLWRWPLVYVYNQRTALTKVPEAAPRRSGSRFTYEPGRDADRLRQSR